MSWDDRPCSSADEEVSRGGRGNGKALSWEYTWQVHGWARSPLWLEQQVEEKGGGNEFSEAAKDPSCVALDFILIMMGIH